MLEKIIGPVIISDATPPKSFGLFEIARILAEEYMRWVSQQMLV